jgi:fatty-acid peroxygenase
VSSTSPGTATDSGTATTIDPPTIPGDQSLRFLMEGYAYGRRRFERLETDAFRTRLMGRPVTFLRGAGAAEFFYGVDRFTRVGAMPRSVLHSLQDEGSVQTLDGDPHARRRTIFLDVLGETRRHGLAALVNEEWAARWQEWSAASKPISLIHASGQVLTDGALRWVGVECTPEERRRLADEFLAMIDGAGSFGLRNWTGRMLRQRTERWARELVRFRRHNGNETLDSPFDRILQQREDGEPLSEQTAAVELLNLLRPIVAVSRFVAFAGLALHRHPSWRERVASDDRWLMPFTEEVRRTTPFFPAIGGKANGAQTWRGLTFTDGDWVLVDFYATHRDARLWNEPDRFDPERFVPHPHEGLIPQGAGSMAEGHRCPGEPATVDLLAGFVRALAHEKWTVPSQDLRVDLRRLPALPGRHGMLIQPSA